MGNGKDIDVVTIGESMVLFQPMPEGTITYAPLYAKSVGGAESNLALVLSRLGKKTRWISRLGNDPFADIILSTLAGEGVDTSQVVKDPYNQTAVFFKESKSYGDPNVYYYRKNSAASQLSSDDISDSWFDGAKHLHVTGITPALGEQTTEMIIEAMKQAKNKGLTVSFDPNLRKKLWSEEKARETLLKLIPLCDIFMPGLDEADFLLGEMKEVEYLKRFQEMGPEVVVLKLGTRGSLIQYGEKQHQEEVYAVDHVVDTVGAGDAFAAGLLSVILDYDNPFTSESLSRSVPRAMQRANLMGALATQFKGDWEGTPTLTEVENLMSGKQNTTR